MSRCIFSLLKSQGSKRRFGCLTNTRLYCRGNQNSGNKSNLGRTTIIVQQGCDIQELPVILRKINGDEFAFICGDKNENLARVFDSGRDMDADAIIKLLDNCLTAAGILSLIDHIPKEDLCPEIAAHAFDRLIRNETLIGLKNLEESSEVFEKLIQCILTDGDPKMLLDFMEVLKTFLDLQKTVQRFCDELLLRNSDGILSIVEVCECIERFVDCKQQEAAEKFWTGISDNEKLINESNIKFIYKILPKLKLSRRLVIGVIERRIMHVWWKLSTEAVTESLSALVESDCSPFRTMQSCSRWINTNIHSIGEAHLESIVRSFSSLSFTNNQVEKALERYIKAKGIKVKSQSLIIAILDHCERFRLRNHHILNGCSEFFIMHEKSIDPATVKSFVTCLGHLDFQPLNSIRFWQVVEKYLQNNLAKIPPETLVEIFLNCCYLEMYPLNFVPSIFNPYFLDKIHTSLSVEKLTKVRSNLKLFDVALTLECDNYSGPLLPRDHFAKSLWQDGRIRRMANELTEHMESIAGGSGNLTKGVIIGKLPTNSLYIIDILIHPPGIGNFWSYSIRNDKNVFVAVLIHLPEHFTSTEDHLIGPQVMRIRHLRRLGMRVVTLKYVDVAQLKVHCKQLRKYLVDRVKKALPAFPEKSNT